MDERLEILVRKLRQNQRTRAREATVSGGVRTTKGALVWRVERLLIEGARARGVLVLDSDDTTTTSFIARFESDGVTRVVRVCTDAWSVVLELVFPSPYCSVRVSRAIVRRLSGWDRRAVSMILDAVQSPESCVGSWWWSIKDGIVQTRDVSDYADEEFGDPDDDIGAPQGESIDLFVVDEQQTELNLLDYISRG
jgi:hypothetical protein